MDQKVTQETIDTGKWNVFHLQILREPRGTFYNKEIFISSCWGNGSDLEVIPYAQAMSTLPHRTGVL